MSIFQIFTSNSWAAGAPLHQCEADSAEEAQAHHDLWLLANGRPPHPADDPREVLNIEPGAQLVFTPIGDPVRIMKTATGWTLVS